ncbi:hypothetical protein D770_12945 [Flammeovirgaceae bacterium 311]|nr:hypothetical protein D770_12945 [Flammeovirgaceae bacterium 311]
MNNTRTLTGTVEEAPDKKLFWACFVALQTIAIFPVFMLVVYLLLILYFRSKGGYKIVVVLKEGATQQEESRKDFLLNEYPAIIA